MQMTPRVLVAYHSGEGQAAKIAARVAEALGSGGARVDLVDCDDAPPPGTYDGVVLGDSIHMGSHSRSLITYVNHHIDQLADVPLALFQVSLTSATHDEVHDRDAREMLEALLETTGLDPDVVGLFAGALKYTQYGWLKRRVLRHIAEAEGASTDTSRDHEYTDWDAVEHFCTDALGLFRAGNPAAG